MYRQQWRRVPAARVKSLRRWHLILPESTAEKPKATKTTRHWSTRKKIIVAVVVGCLIATAIAVPVGVHAHLQHEHAANARALYNLIVKDNQETSALQRIQSQITTDLQQEQRIQNLLSRGHISQTQTASLESQLTTLQVQVSGLQATANRTQLASLLSTNFFGHNIRHNRRGIRIRANVDPDVAAMFGFGH